MASYMGTVPTMSGVFCTSSWRKKRVFPELERSMMASAPSSPTRWRT